MSLSLLISARVGRLFSRSAFFHHCVLRCSVRYVWRRLESVTINMVVFGFSTTASILCQLNSHFCRSPFDNETRSNPGERREVNLCSPRGGSFPSDG